MKYGREFTIPALLAGMGTFLAILETLETYSLNDLRQLAQVAFNGPLALPP